MADPMVARELTKIRVNLEDINKAVSSATPLEIRIREVALVAAALQPHPGGVPLYERAEAHAKYIREGVLGETDAGDLG